MNSPIWQTGIVGDYLYVFRATHTQTADCIPCRGAEGAELGPFFLILCVFRVSAASNHQVMRALVEKVVVWMNGQSLWMGVKRRDLIQSA